MPSPSDPPPASTPLSLEQAADFVDLSAEVLSDLAASGYLAPARICPAGPEFHVTDLKAFVARNADNGTGGGVLAEALAAAPPPEPTPIGRQRRRKGDIAADELLELLDQRSEGMAFRVFKIYSVVFPEARDWSERRQQAFVRQTKTRFEALLAVTELGGGVDPAILDDLREVGAAAAEEGTPLDEVMAILRISRDLMMQNAIDLVETEGRPGGQALSLILNRIVPTMDRLTDALSRGYWERRG